MADQDDSLEGTHHDLAKLLVNRGIITPHQLEVAIKQYEERKGTPREQRLEKILLEDGFVQDEQFLDNLRIQTRAFARCTKCGKLYTIIYFNPATAYVCKACGSKLEHTEVTEPTIQAGSILGSTSSSGSSSDGGSRSTAGMTMAVFSDAQAAPEPARMPPEVQAASQDPKRLFGKYVITKELGRGGTAIVYKAWDTSLCQYVALKLIKIDDVEDGSSVEATSQIRDFQKEARMSARFRHPNIIRIYELGCIDNKHYLAMELMEGPTLAEVIHGSRQRNMQTKFHTEPEKFLAILRDVARAVHYAHTQTPPVIHRDLKPQNVLLDMKGVPYVADFGLAKEAELGRSDTVTGVVKGTPSYMAPEQAEGHNRDTDHRTDVYALGAILYEMITGRPPFLGENVRQVLNQIVTRIPDRPNDVIAKMIQGQPESPNQPKPVARQLETICLKCLEKKKPDRYQTALEFGEDLDRFLQNMEIEAREPSIVKKAIRKLRAHPIITGAVSALLLAGIVAGLILHFRPAEKGSVAEIVAIARDHQKAQDWSSLKADVDSLRKIDPGNSNIPVFKKALEDHEKDLQQKRADWETMVKRLKSEPLNKVVEDLRKAYRAAGELKAEHWSKLERALLETQAGCLSEARGLFGRGPNQGWLQEKVKQDAKRCRELAGHLLALAGDADFKFQPDVELTACRESLDRILGYLGTWHLRVNVTPYAEVVLLRDGKKVAQEWTPLGMRELEVASGYQLQVFWPSQADPKQRSVQELKDLRNGAAVVVTGEAAKPQVRIQP